MVSNPVVAKHISDDPPVLDPKRPLSQPFRDAVSTEISAFLRQQAALVDEMGAELGPVRQLAARLLTGGKRLRPAFCVWSYVAAGGLPTDDLKPVLAAAGSLEMLHVSALVHDDVMDSSDLRRGQPAAHRQFEAMHAAARWLGDPAGFGRAAAILLGDLLLVWSFEMLQRSGLPDAALSRALPIVEAMRTEVTCGQYLDLVAQARPLEKEAQARPLEKEAQARPLEKEAQASAAAHPDIARALDQAGRVVEYKSARYTVQRPCQLGAALAGGDPQLHAALAAYGSPLGRAFQYRDDLLGVFGDTQLTGKPAGDDLREGKRTVLIAYAVDHADDAGRQLLLEQLGNPALTADGIADLQQVIADSGARDSVEMMIDECYQAAMTALGTAQITDEGRLALSHLADAAVRRAF